MQKDTTDQSRKQLKNFTHKDLWSEKKPFQPKTISELRSMESGLAYTTLDDKKRIVQHSYETGEPIETLFDVAWDDSKRVTEIESYSLATDGARILLATKKKKIYRHSYTATHYIWNVRAKTLTPLSDRRLQQLATFSPNGSKVAFVSGNDLFVKDLESGKEVQVTNDGRVNKIINGASDWVYEEEFALEKAFAWSPDGAYLAYLRFDESHVKEFTMQRFTGGYPENVAYKYPRAGEKNAIVSVHLFDVKSSKSHAVDVGEETDQYIPRVKWTKTPGVLVVLRLNRLQNRLDFLECNAADGSSTVIHTEKNDRYLDVDDSLTFLDDREHFIVLSERSGWRHVHLYSMKGRHVRQLTNGDWDVADFHGYNEENRRVYYTAAKPTPLVRGLYSIKLDGTDEQKLTAQDGSNITDFSKGLYYFINTYSNTTTPPVISLHDSSGKLIRVLEDNAALKKKLQNYFLPKKEFFKFTTSEGIELNAWIMKPKGFDAKKKYPVLMTVYGGPNSQTVTDGWCLNWDNYLTQKGYIIASVDGRGTGSRGEDFRKCTYQQLGKFEVADQIEGAKYLGTLPYVDASRIGIFGWSYGGFMSAGCILRGTDAFKAAIAVATVTNFRYYDTIYTERYMRTPQENPTGYDDNAPLTYAKDLKGKLLLVHGVTDDNVHCQNSLQLAEALAEAGKHFEVHFLPNRDHGISGGNTRLHLHYRFTDFLKKNL